MRSKMQFKTGIYFSHYECFGHTAHVMAIGEVLKRRFPQGNLFFIQAGIPQPKAQINRVGKVYALPGVLTNRHSFVRFPRQAGTDASGRSQACLNIIARERPDLFITEFFPLGREECRHELILPLIKASAQGSRLWSVAGYPLLTGKDHEWRQKILKLYQKIIILSPPIEKKFIADRLPHVRERQKYSDFFKRNARKIVFAGYLSPRQEVVVDDAATGLLKPPVPKGACRITVVRGGGAYFSKLIAQAIRASDLLGKDYYMTVVAGPSTTPQEWELFSALLSKKKVDNLALHRAVGHYEELIKESDVCVSVASYHTSVMLLKHRKKAVVVPFEGYGVMSFHEQPARAALLKETIGAKILSIRDLTADILAAAVRDVATHRKVSLQIPEEWFRGGEVLDKALSGLYEK
ncbi:MAG: hypothetical protein HQL14_06795 [Candidatus Omnitrophica bacterium]|nr:hypothetical protein [Candidatus Omnitrophota bacterium]